MAAVCVRHSDVSGVWASLGCKCLFASVGEALALACCVGMGRCMRGGGQGSSMSWRACAHCHRECHYHSLSCSHTRTTFCVRWNGQGGAIFADSSAIDIQHSSFVGNSAVCSDLAFAYLSCSLSPSHIAKGPEIEPRHRLVLAVGIMRLVAGQARLVR